MRQLTNQFLAQLMGQDSNDPFLVLLTLTHTDFVAPVYLVNNTENVTSNGQVFTAFPFEIVLSPDDGESQRVVKINLSNIGLELIDELRSVTTPIGVKIQMILYTDPDEIQIELEDLKLVNVTYNVESISGTLILDDFLNTEMTSEKYGPQNFPGLFG